MIKYNRYLRNQYLHLFGQKLQSRKLHVIQWVQTYYTSLFYQHGLYVVILASLVG